MVARFVFSNLTHRPTRAAASVMGIALGMVLILVTVGLARGMLSSSGKRESRVGAELLFQPSGAFGPGVTATPLTLPVAYAKALAEIEGVAAATPVGRHVRSGAGGLGFELIEGVVLEEHPDHATYQQITGLAVAEGRLPTGEGEIMVDRERVRAHGAGLGTTMELLGRPFEIVGIYEPEVGARIKMPLASMQKLLAGDRKASWILVKTRTPEIQEEVAGRIDARFPGHQLIYTRDIPGFYEKGLPSLRVFLKVVVGLAMVISSLVTLLALYTAVTERTREIGVLKSLGASRLLIVGLIQKEALLLSMLGVGLGLASAVAVGAVITNLTTLTIQFELKWFLFAASVALIGGGLGALYPALRAAQKDPVEALAHE